MVVLRFVPILMLLAMASCSAPKETATPPMINDGREAIRLDVPSMTNADPAARRLDSLVAISKGDYLHMEVSQCFGRCEARVSIFRESPAKYHIYEADAWQYDEFERGDIQFRMRKPMSSDVADGLLQQAYELGVMRLGDDTTHLMTDQPYLWLRARFGAETVRVDRAYVGGAKYAGDGRTPGMSAIYAKIRQAMLAPLFNANPADVEKRR